MKPEVQEVAKHLIETVEWAEKYRKHLEARSTGGLEFSKAIDLKKAFSEPPPPPKAWPKKDDEHVVTWAYRMMIRAYGESLYAFGGADAMDEAYDAVEAKLGTLGSLTVDRAWEGIGGW